MVVERKRFGFSPLEIKIVNRANNQRNKKFLTGFTIVELLTVLAIIAMLVALLIPALALVRNIAKQTQQKAQFTTIELALTAFKSDYGDYPPSEWNPVLSPDYCGAQKFAEALLGWDLMGFHPESAWRADGKDKDGGDETYDKTRDDDNDNVPDTLNERRGQYLELTTANAFKLRDLFGAGQTTPLEEDTFVICDVFGAKKITLAAGQTAKAGTPILYYRANTASKKIVTGGVNERIYNSEDNLPLINLKRAEDGKDHLLGNEPFFYSEDGIINPKVTAMPWPHRPDSYILISAGADGEYGTSDDIRNF